MKIKEVVRGFERGRGVVKCIRRKGATRRRRRRRRFRESTRTIIRSRLAGSKDPRDDISMPCLQNNSNYPRYTKKNTKSNAWNSGERPRRYFHLFSSLFRSPLEPPTLAPTPLSPLTIPLTPASPPPLSLFSVSVPPFVQVGGISTRGI